MSVTPDLVPPELTARTRVSLVKVEKDFTRLKVLIAAFVSAVSIGFGLHGKLESFATTHDVERSIKTHTDAPAGGGHRDMERLAERIAALEVRSTGVERSNARIEAKLDKMTEILAAGIDDRGSRRRR